MGCFVNCIHYYVNVLSVYLGSISSDVENRYNIYYSVMLCLHYDELIHSYLNAGDIFSSGSPH